MEDLLSFVNSFFDREYDLQVDSIGDNIDLAYTETENRFGSFECSVIYDVKREMLVSCVDDVVILEESINLQSFCKWIKDVDFMEVVSDIVYYVEEEMSDDDYEKIKNKGR